MNINMRIITLTTMAVLAGVTSHLHAEENCNAWRIAETDTSGGQYLLELRSCDLTYGLSAYIQFKNPSDSQLRLTYRLTTKDDKSKEGEITLEPNSVTRAGNCQACAKRNAGIKAWDIVSVKALAKAPPPATAEVPAAAPASEQSLVKIQQPSLPVTEKTSKAAEPAAAIAQPSSVEKAVVENKATTNPAITEQQPKVEKKPELNSFKAEDGTIIPFDQLPPEFRPRK